MLMILRFWFAFGFLVSSLSVGSAQEAGPSDDSGETADVELEGELEAVLAPLFKSMSGANVSRATVEMLADSVMNGQVVESEKSTFQIASKSPDRFTIYLKETEQRTRLYCNGEKLVAAMAPDAYFDLPQPISMQEAVLNLPVPMGPYPEPLLALSMAGVDPSVTMVAGMKSIDLVDREPFRGKVPAVHIHGVQADSVTWDLWLTDTATPRPLRLLVDMTPMLVESDQVHVPPGFSYQVRYDFLTWRITGDVDDSLFVFKPAKDAVKYESLEDYYESIAGLASEHPLLGRPVPQFTTETVGGKPFDSKSLAGRVVVIDFWATWCTPCLAAMPVVKKVTDDFAKKGVILLAVNTGEDRETVKEFLAEQDLKMNIVLDPEGQIADGFRADAIPQTLIIGKTGMVESVHVGFNGEADLTEKLTEDLNVLCAGGKLGSAPPENGRSK